MAVRSTFCINSINKLNTPLGDWIVSPSTHPKWGYEEKTNSLWKQEGKEWFQFQRVGSSRRLPKFSVLSKSTGTVPTFLLPTTVQIRRNFIHTEGFSFRSKDPTVCNIHLHENLSCWSWLIKNVKIFGSITAILDSIQLGTLIAVSDGSFKQELGLGTAAWVLSTPNKSNYIYGTSTSPGPPEIQSAYRSEILGLLAILEFIKHLVEKHNIQNGKITLFCDGESALDQLSFLTTDSLHTRFKQCDLLSACIKIKTSIPLTLITKHVKGHQDDYVPAYTLPLPAQLNIWMDSLAKQHLNNNSFTYEQRKNFCSHPLSFPTISIRNTKVYHCIKNTLYSQIAELRITSAWTDKQRLTSTTTSLIAWEVQDKAMTSCNINRHRFIVKWSSNNLATGKNMTRWKLRQHGRCPYCLAADEDKIHILRCTSTDVPLIWNKEITSFNMKLANIDTSPALRREIVCELNSWRDMTPSRSLRHLDPDLTKVILSQRLIGWDKFLEGLICTGMIEYQSDYFLDTESRYHAPTWGVKVIKNCWNILWNIWQARNSQLHHTAHIQDMEGYKELRSSILQEWRIGLGQLPIQEFSHFFKESLQSLLHKGLESQKSWFLTIQKRKNPSPRR